ncbi:VDE1 [Auxenochlorella protothecoides x Auxenochlorella symbiontica]
MALAAAISLSPALPSLAADMVKTGTCLLQKCQPELARCLIDGECVENLVCLQVCNGKDDESGCQVKCADRYKNDIIDKFNACAITSGGCVPQKIEKDTWKAPPASAIDRAFDPELFQGRWYITAGLNPLFDVFDCQEHFFASPSPGSLYGKIRWRIPKGSSDFIERSTMQRFVQDPGNPGVLYNHDNEYLHYEDDWYVVGWEPDSYAFIVYKGQNDAWKGYGGATVYTRDSSFPPELTNKMRELASQAGLKWEEFKLTDNSCGPHPPQRGGMTDFEREMDDLARDEARQGLASFSRGLTVIEQRAERAERDIAQSVVGLEKTLQDEFYEAEKQLASIEKQFSASGGFGAWLQNIFRF